MFSFSSDVYFFRDVDFVLIGSYLSFVSTIPYEVVQFTLNQYKDIQRRQEESGRTYITMPPRKSADNKTMIKATTSDEVLQYPLQKRQYNT
jgi:hypothetical protein